jgi:tetratricopeptide (TPR) repeat protein
LLKAAAVQPADSLALELYGTLSSWAPDVVSREAAAVAYVEAAARRFTEGAGDAQMENLLRAFDIDPSSSQAVAALAAALTDRGKILASDEAWRAHAATLVKTDSRRGAAVQARRRLQARAADDVARALGAALDEGLDACVVGDGTEVLDDLLLRVGLLEPLAARLEIRAELTTGSARARALAELARLFTGALARPDRAAAIRVLALASDPTSDESLVGLRAYASATHDASHLVDGLIRATGFAGSSLDARTGEQAADIQIARAAHARALAQFAEEELGDGALAAWAYSVVLQLCPGDPGALLGMDRNAERRETARREGEAIETTLDSAKGDERLEPLRVLAGLLASRPDEGARHAAVLAELVDLEGNEGGWLAEGLRLARRRGDFREMARLAEVELARAESVLDFVEARSALAAALRGLGETSRANEATRPLLTEAAGNKKALGVVWVNAALADDPRTRAGAIEQLASVCSTPVRSVMLAVAADVLRGIGDGHAARRLAEQSCQADPSSARSIATLANATLGSHDRMAASALERGIHVVFAKSSWCWALAQGLEAMGELGYAVGWTQRGVALCPGDRRGVEVLLRRIVRARDGARLADALTWVLAQPFPGGPLADLVAEPLRDLATLDPDRAQVIARRTLDICGARSGTLRNAMIDVADAVRDDAFAAIVLERALAVDFSSDRGELVLALVRRREALGDVDGEVRALAQAAREGLWSRELAERLSHIPGSSLSGDGRIARMEAMAETLLRSKDKEGAANVLRELGAMYFDLAGDRAAAVRVWLKAARLAPNGFWILGMDLARFAGGRYALDCLTDLVEKETHKERAGALAAEAARAALALGEPDRAFALATTAILRNPRLADALETAEKGAVSSGRTSEMTHLYDLIANAALGRFGRRAAHYRAARFFDKGSVPGLALKHAASAFGAVPSEGAAFVLLRRMAERAEDPGQALRTIVQVAEASSTPAARASWLLRAAAVAGRDEDGLRMKVDVLLRAALLVPQIATLSLLEEAAVDLLRLAPDERDSIDVRLSRAGRTITAKVDGPDGSRVALRFASLGLKVLSDDTMAFHAIERAFHADADLEEFSDFVPFAERLAHAGNAEALGELVALTEAPYANVGLAALELLIAMALARGEARYYARLSVTAVEKSAQDPSLIHRVDAAIRQHLEWRAVDAHGAAGPSLGERLDRVAPVSLRASVLRTCARERSLAGDHDGAITLLERAVELAGGEARGDVQRELIREYEASGRAEELEDRALKEATNEHATELLRALRWSEVAERREARGDLVGAVDALLAAARLDPAPIERWSGLERVAELAGAEETRIQAIREIAVRVEPDARAAVDRRLARAYAARGDADAAEATWQTILARDPRDEDSDYAIEALITARGDYSDLANHLGKRIERLSRASGTTEALRAVRLRRAAILEQRLSRTEDACEELSRVLDEAPDNLSALSYLADLKDRMGDYARAAPLWRRVASLARDARTQNDAGIRSGRAAALSGDPRAALLSAREILAREPGHKEALDLCVSASRATGGDRELGDALEDAAMASSEDAKARSDMLLEASVAAARAGDTETAMARAQRAAQITPSYAPAQLAARTLEYRSRGAGTPEDARRTVQELSLVVGPIQRDEAAIQAFLIAEALDAFQGGGAGLALLLDKQREYGGHPVLALGIAERLVAKFDFASALPYFRAALLFEPWDLRDRGRVALAGADAAVRAGEHEVAIRLLEEAASQESTRTDALLRAAEIAASQGDSARATSVLEGLAGSTDGEPRERALAQLSRLQRDSVDYQVVAAPAESALRMDLLAEREAVRTAGVSPSPVVPPAENLPDVPPSSVRPPSAPPSQRPFYDPPPSVSFLPDSDSPPPPSVTFPASDSVHATSGPEPQTSLRRPRAAEPSSNPVALERAVREAVTRDEATAARLALARAHLRRGSVDAAELCLQEGFSHGGTEEGDMIAMLLEAEPERSSDLVKVRRRLAEIVPGDLLRLEDLRRAAVADKNQSYARAVEHVSRSFDPGAGPLPPPALGAQNEQPGFMALLTQPGGDPIAQALACVWEEAPQAFATGDAAAELRGAQRIAAGGSSPIAWLYEAAVRLLDIPRIPLFVKRGSDPVAARVLLTSPPSVLLTGFPNEDNAEVRIALGHGLAGALPTGALVVGASREEGRARWEALLAAFGPPEASRFVGRGSGRLAEALWQALPARTQRRLQTMLSSVAHDDFEPIATRVRQAGYRVGMFLTGDFGVTARTLLLDLSRNQGGVPPLSEHSLRHLCTTQPGVADLFRLAVSPEYADARWRLASSGSQSNVRTSSGRFGGA